MKSFYLLITAANCITLSSKYYKIAAGTSKRDQQALSYMRFYAVNKGYYFSVWNNDSAEFVYKIATSLGVNLFQLDFHTINVRDIVKSVKSDKELPSFDSMTASSIYFRNIIDDNFRIQRQIDVLRKAEAKTRNKPKVLNIRP